MKRTSIVLLIAAMLATLGASAQSGGYMFGGLLVDRERISPTDVFSLSQTNTNFGTARSMAMAGAFTSLGADLSSMTINPAGLGMYRRSEVSFTPMMGFERSSNSAEANLSNKKNRFSVANLGFVIKAYEGTGDLLAVNIGFGYNRIADFNYQYSFAQGGNGSTLGGVMARQLQTSAGGIHINDNNRITDSYGNTDFGLSTELWGGVLGYKCGLLGMRGGEWTLDEYPIPFTTDQFTTVESKGSVGEYTLSVGMNIRNKFYVGASLGIQSIRQKKWITYGENIYPDSEVDPATQPYLLEWFDYAQASEISGTGVNFKLGVTWRPTDALRLGFAIHTPTYYSLNFSYAAGMGSASRSIGSNPDGYEVVDGYVYGSQSTPQFDDNGPDSWEFVSPTRMLFGASYTFGSFAVVSVDYERDWYNGIRMKNMPAGFSSSYYNDFFRHALKGSNTVRIGAEIKPTARLALRAGYGYNGSMLRESEDNYLLYTTPVVYRTDFYTAGIGFAVSPSVTLDAAYQYVDSRMTDYRLFFADNGNPAQSDYSGLFSTSLCRHNVALTLSVKF